LKSQETGKVTLAKNPSFYDPKAQYLGGVEFSNVGQGVPSINALQSGIVHLIWGMPPDSVQSLESNGMTVEAVPSSSVYVLGLCPTSGVSRRSRRVRPSRTQWIGTRSTRPRWRAPAHRTPRR
jgi:ABC-type transport system substrate-binding protein